MCIHWCKMTVNRDSNPLLLPVPHFLLIVPELQFVSNVCQPDNPSRRWYPATRRVATQPQVVGLQLAETDLV
jgi:hypothetical protein